MTEQSLSSKTVIITGANSGIGLEAAKVLAGIGMRLVIAVRNDTKGAAARNEILSLHPGASVEIRSLDVADLSSVRSFAESILRDFSALDVLINNAGVMIPPYSKTKDGFEMQFGSNHLGHFALTAQLLPLLLQTPKSRIVTIGSLAHNRGAIDFDNLDGSRGYQAKKFYNQSKLANMLFALELDRRLKKHGAETISVVCHPGVSGTNIFKLGGRDAPLFIRNLANKFYLQPPAIGALATVHAATAPHLTGGEYIGPDGPGRRKGYPALETPHPSALDEEVAKQLWDISEELTGIKFKFGS
ncbi:oxidoreductase [Planococcus beigongshangi]|uniref:oxidoreductase n=1 Tax=Planococcus beigongshangi TaxID=2782536 RepID=UPI00193AE864|nr:oxidoreductase [Planococcus beigongshangi]